VHHLKKRTKNACYLKPYNEASTYQNQNGSVQLNLGKL